jgi:peptidoglycan/LPS O-acetylase OafA/YrhL
MKEKDQLLELQSLRGLASFSVMAGHATYFFAVPASWWNRLQGTLFNGTGMVIIFFVLSGFVLTRSLLSHPFTWRAVASFVVKRVCRIYPAIWAASIIGILGLPIVDLIRTWPQVAPWVVGAFPVSMSLKTLILGFAGISNRILPPLWTISIELAGSALLLFTCLSIRRSMKLFYGLFGLAAIFSLTLGSKTPYAIGLFLVDFLLGSWIAVVSSRGVGERFRPNPALTIAATLCLLFARGLLQPAPRSILMHAVEAVCALILVHGIVIGYRPRFLRSPALVWIGDISYSIYLVHFPVFIVVGYAIFQIFGTAGIGANFATGLLSCLLTVPLSAILYRYVEQPGIAVGNILMKHLRFRSHEISGETASALVSGDLATDRA